MHTRRRALQNLGAAACLLGSQTVFAQPSSPKRKIKVGQIGVGHAHANKLSVYRASDDYDVVGIVEPDVELQSAVKDKAPYNDLPWMTEEQLLNVPDLDAVLVETQVENLLATAQTCIDAGKHVHLDKPAGESLAAYRKLLNDAEKKDLLVQMGYMYRYNPAIIMLHKFLDEGWLGEVFELHTVMSKVVDPKSRQQLAKFPGGMMFELGCHIIDLAVGVLGAPDQVTAYAQSVHADKDSLSDNMLAVLEYPRATATIKTSALEVEGFSRRHLVVCGTGGTFHIQPLDNPSARVALNQSRGEFKASYQDISFPKFERYVADATDMAHIIRGEKAMDFSYTHDLNVQTTVLRASGLENRS
ncbi:MAG: Gfo/Idh/MocA family oxidoreductase [Pirellulaceae bacterium]